MAYERFYPLCKEHSHGEMTYNGDGDYECLVCGFEYHDDDFEEDEEDEL